MDEQESATTENDAGTEAQPQLREWLTPTFERIALKDAFGGTGAFSSTDGIPCAS